MDPLSALSNAGNIIQFVDFGCKLVSRSRQLYKSLDGVLSDKVIVEVLAHDLKSLSTNLRNSLRENQPVDLTRQVYSEDDAALDDLCRRCQGIAEKLLSRLYKLKVQGVSSYRNWESFKKALRSSWSREEIDSLAAQLHEIRSEIEFRVLISFRGSLKALATQQTRASHQLTESTHTIITTFLSIRDEFANELKRQAEKLVELQGYKEMQETEMQEAEMRRTERHGTLQTLSHQADEEEMGTPRSHELSATGIQVEQEMMLLMIENGILGTLDFTSIRDRHEEVEIAHNQTFEWIYRDSKIGDKSWDNFVEWLQHDTGLYWINGKAGSGKSTLMKYIYDHHKTREELKKWAGTSTCDVSGFFFWNSGSEEQRSQRGLLRTLLFETLQSHRDLLPSIFPSAWDSWSTRVKTAIKQGTAPSKASLLSREPKPWTLSQLKRAFRILLQKYRSKDIKLCIFIDGLDEYDGDHDDIVEYFLDFAREPGIKMCLSSRPLVVFEEAFSGFPGLKLQNLTYGDIGCYVEDKLGSHRHMAKLSLKSPEQARLLVTEIVTKADGVFLWVKLVVKSLLQGLRDQNRIVDLQRRLRHLPADLEALYEHMLEKTDPFYLEQASQIFQIILVAQKESTSRQITLLQLSWAEDEDKPAIIALTRALTTEEATDRCKLMDTRLKSVCSGLLESYDSKYSNTGPDARVVFMHRTVSDFFKKPNVWDKITKHTHGTSFSPHLSLLRSCILQLKALKADHASPLDMAIIGDALSYAKKAEDDLGTGFPALLDQLDAAATYQWRMFGGKGVRGRVETKTMDSQEPKEGQGWSKPSRKIRGPHFLDLESEPDVDSDVEPDFELDFEPVSDDYFDCLSDEKSPTRPSVPQCVILGSQPQHMGEGRTIGYKQPSTMSKSIPIGASHGTSINGLRPPPVPEGQLHNWTYGIEFSGVKPFKHVVPFYDLAKALGLQHYVAHKDASGLMVDHDVNHHMLLHAVSCYSRNHHAGRSQVPDPAILQRALEAGADPNFSFHGSTPWEEALTGVLSHLSLHDFDEEAPDFKSPQGEQWIADAETWVGIMKIFLQHGASPTALSKQPRRKPLAIVQKFPEALASQAEELMALIRALMIKSAPRGGPYDPEPPGQNAVGGATGERMAPDSVFMSKPSPEAEVVPLVSAISMLFSWFVPAKKSKKVRGG